MTDSPYIAENFDVSDGRQKRWPSQRLQPNGKAREALPLRMGRGLEGTFDETEEDQSDSSNDESSEDSSMEEVEIDVTEPIHDWESHGRYLRFEIGPFERPSQRRWEVGLRSDSP